MMQLPNILEDLKKTLLALDGALAPVATDRRKESAAIATELAAKKNARRKTLSGLVPDNVQASSEKEIKAFLSKVRMDIEGGINGCLSQIVGLNQRIDELKQKLADKTSILSSTEIALKKVQGQRDALKREVDKRWFIVSIWKGIFGDPEKQRLAQLGDEVLKRCNNVEDIKRERDNIQRELSCEKADLAASERRMAEYKRKLSDCQSRLRKVGDAERLNDEIEYLLLRERNCASRIDDAQRDALDRKNQALLKLNGLCKEVRACQPQLATLSPDAFGVARSVCDLMAFGRIRLCFRKDKIGYIPRILPFPIKRSIVFGKAPQDKQWIADFLLRTFQCLPPSQISITAIDPIELGKSLPDFQILLKNDNPFPAKRILTRSDEIEAALNEHLHYVEDLSQKVFVSDVKDWSDYNRKNPDNPLVYKLLVMFGLPEQLTDKGALYLARLIEHGPRCGVLPILSCSRESFDERKHAALLEVLDRQTWSNAEIYKHSSITAVWRQLSFTEEPEPPVESSKLHAIMLVLEEKFRLAGRFSGAMPDLWKNDSLWNASSKDGLEADVGWTSQGNMPVRFKLGDNPAHALFGGKTGTGKSNFIHVLIHSLCHRYSPKELEVYLLDYKEGVEFNCYAHPSLSHARLVATESDIEYGIAVLEHLKREYQERAAVFKQLGVRDYRGFRERGHDGMPRVVVIIDEFQKLFEGDRQSSETAEQLLVTLLKQARAAGIHVILSTQTVRGLQNQSVSGLIGQLGCRVALSCSVDDSYLLLGSGNDAAATLHSPPEGILNLENGSKSANVRFCIPFADEKIRARKQDLLVAEAQQRGYRCKNTIFNGKTLPALPVEDRFAEIATHPGCQMLLGESHDFDAKPFTVDVSDCGVLVAGFNPQLRTGLLNTMLLNIKAYPEVRVIYYSSGRAPSVDVSLLGDRVVYKDASWDFADFEKLLADNPGVFFIVDTFDHARRFTPPAIGSYRKPGTPESPWDILKRYSDPLVDGHARVILFVENYRRFMGSAKDLFNLFDLRIGFGLDEDDAGAFVSGSVAKLKGLQDLSKVVFVNRNEGGMPVFLRPFSVLQQV